MNNLIKKGVVVAVILLFVSVSIVPSTGNTVIENYVSTDNQIYMSNSRNDTTPPVTNHSLNGTFGENGIYISEVEITLNATDDMSGVNATYYLIIPSTYLYTEPFVVAEEGQHLVGYHSVDNAGNVEDWKYTPSFRIDLYPPYIEVVGGWEKEYGFWVYADVSDTASGVERVEFYIEDDLMHVVYYYPYKWNYSYSGDHTVTAIVYDKAGHNASDELFQESFFSFEDTQTIYNYKFVTKNLIFYVFIARDFFIKSNHLLLPR